MNGQIKEQPSQTAPIPTALGDIITVDYEKKVTDVAEGDFGKVSMEHADGEENLEEITTRYACCIQVFMSVFRSSVCCMVNMCGCNVCIYT